MEEAALESTTAIRVSGLHKQFGRGKRQIKAVQNLDLEVKAGQVYGFLGPNGAGKTTTIRMLLDLIRPTSGTAMLFGESVQRNPVVLKRVGALVEGATFYPYLTGRKNLEVLARSGGYYDPKRVQAIIEQVGMADRADRRAKGYSTGMKQRMGLAATLLSSPDLIILDEPTNGLDPAGIQEMRLFIRELADKEGKTVFLSSHMLNEIEQVSDSITIIRDGKSIETLNVKADGVDEDRIIKGMVGRTLESRFPDHEPKIGEVLFEVKNWNVGHPQIHENDVGAQGFGQCDGFGA